VVEKPPIPSSDRPGLLFTETCDKSTLDEPIFEQQHVDLGIIEPPEHKEDVYPNVVAKNGKKRSHKLSNKKPDVGFVNKRAGRLISRSLQNKTKAHASSGKTIDILDDYDSEIEIFLEEEEPGYHRTVPDQPYNFVGNLPPCLKHEKNFPGIKLSQNSTLDSGSVLTHSHSSPQSTVPDLRCEVCLFWIEKYYTDVPSLQAKIKAFTAQIDSLTTENHRLKLNAQRPGKRLKRTGNIIIKNVEYVKVVVNSEVL
jgi:hypothetical protein